MSSSNEPTAAQRAIGDISPKLVELTDRVLFGDVAVTAINVAKDVFADASDRGTP